jgi:hypothetical protein
VGRLDGAAPRNAECVHCGFLLGGIPIRGNAITCPECGREVVFELPKVKPPVSAWWVRGIALVGVAALAGVVWPAAGWRGAAAVVVSCGLLWLTMAAVRKLIRP